MESDMEIDSAWHALMPRAMPEPSSSSISSQCGHQGCQEPCSSQSVTNTCSKCHKRTPSGQDVSRGNCCSSNSCCNHSAVMNMPSSHAGYVSASNSCHVEFCERINCNNCCEAHWDVTSASCQRAHAQHTDNAGDDVTSGKYARHHTHNSEVNTFTLVWWRHSETWRHGRRLIYLANVVLMLCQRRRWWTKFRTTLVSKYDVFNQCYFKITLV